MRAYGAARDLFAVAGSCRFFFKIGGAAGRNEIGTISILCRGPDGVVLHGKTVLVVYYAYCSLCKMTFLSFFQTVTWNRTSARDSTFRRPLPSPSPAGSSMVWLLAVRRRADRGRSSSTPTLPTTLFFSKNGLFATRPPFLNR